MKAITAFLEAGQSLLDILADDCYLAYDGPPADHREAVFILANENDEVLHSELEPDKLEALKAQYRASPDIAKMPAGQIVTTINTITGRDATMRQLLVVIHTDRPEVAMLDTGSSVDLHLMPHGHKLQELGLATAAYPSATTLTGLGNAVMTSHGEQDLIVYITDATGSAYWVHRKGSKVVTKLPVSSLIGWPTILGIMFIMDFSDSKHPHFIIDPRGGSTATVEWTEVSLDQVAEASRASVAAQLAIARPPLPKGTADRLAERRLKKRYSPIMANTSQPAPTSGGGRPTPSSPASPTPPTVDHVEHVQREIARIRLHPPPPRQLNPLGHTEAIWDRQQNESSHTIAYGLYLHSHQLATAPQEGTQQLTLVLLDPQGSIGSLTFLSTIRPNLVRHADTNVHLPPLIVGRNVVEACAMPTRITEEGQDYWFFVLRPSGSNAWCVWQILSIDDAPRVAQSSIIGERNERITEDPTPRVTDEWKPPLMVGGRVDNDGI